MSIPIIRRALLGAAVPLGLAVSIARPALAGSLDVVASFTAKPSQLDVATYTDPNQKPSKVGLLSISHGNAIALGAADWKSLIDLVHKAAAATASAAWTVVGSIKDVSKDVATLTVTAAPACASSSPRPRAAPLPISCPSQTLRAWKRRWLR
jgi:hypothetical protein